MSWLASLLASLFLALCAFSHDQATLLRLHELSTTEYTALSHSRFPGHGVRVKKTEFCDPTVNVYTGYLDIDQGAKHLFFYFFESRHDPENDDVMMWINGGPGASSAVGLLMELGPCSIDMSKESDNGTIWNPYGWNEAANIFFLDQPVGVGFSYADYGEHVGTTEEAARNVYAFLTIFFETFKQFSGRPLHLAGESYAGRYLPIFASEVYDQNQIAKAQRQETLNLTSVIIGNGITDISTLYRGRFEIECGKAAFDVPFQSISTCVRMKMALPRCEEAMQRSCIDSFDPINCNAAVSFCDSELSSSMHASGRNNYDISKPCIGDDLCYAESAFISTYLNQPSTHDLLGIAPHRNYTGYSEDVQDAFDSNMDKWRAPTQMYVSGLLERGVRVLIYGGTYDWQCNWVANKLWTDKLQWSGAAKYQEAAFRDWTVDGDVVGQTRSSGGLTFATVLGAGHMVPHDKPVEALTLIQRWLAQESL